MTEVSDAPIELILAFGLPLFATLVFLFSRIFGGPRLGAEPSSHRETLLPIHRAALSGDWEAILRALQSGDTLTSPVPHGVNEEGAHALHLAAGGGHAEVVSLLLERGAPVSARDSMGRLALHHAAVRGQTACVGTLLGAGAIASAVDNHGMTALQLAEEGRHTDAAALLRAR